jgi:hypothetical protein
VGGQRNRSHLGRPWPGVLLSVALWNLGRTDVSRTAVARDRASQRISAGQRCLPRIEGERSVKPSAQPTLVRTQHLPHPGETAR